MNESMLDITDNVVSETYEIARIKAEAYNESTEIFKQKLVEYQTDIFSKLENEEKDLESKLLKSQADYKLALKSKFAPFMDEFNRVKKEFESAKTKLGKLEKELVELENMQKPNKGGR